MRALEVDPEARHPSAAELAGELERFRITELGGIRRRGLGARAARAAGSAAGAAALSRARSAAGAGGWGLDPTAVVPIVPVGPSRRNGPRARSVRACDARRGGSPDRRARTASAASGRPLRGRRRAQPGPAVDRGARRHGDTGRRRAHRCRARRDVATASLGGCGGRGHARRDPGPDALADALSHPTASRPHAHARPDRGADPAAHGCADSAPTPRPTARPTAQPPASRRPPRPRHGTRRRPSGGSTTSSNGTNSMRRRGSGRAACASIPAGGQHRRALRPDDAHRHRPSADRADEPELGHGARLGRPDRVPVVRPVAAPLRRQLGARAQRPRLVDGRAAFLTAGHRPGRYLSRSAALMSTAWAAARRATGTRNGEHDT